MTRKTTGFCFAQNYLLRRRKEKFLTANGWKLSKFGWSSPYPKGYRNVELDVAYNYKTLLHETD